MSKLTTLLATGVVAVAVPSFASESLNTYQNFTGFTGLINTSNAKVLSKGSFGISYTNMLDSFGREFVDGHNFVFSAGLYDGLEVSGQIASHSTHDNLFDPRVNNGDEQQRDLSFNAKYQLSFLPIDWFDIAVGAKDIGGALNRYETYFAVASKEFSDFRFSLGVATSEHEAGVNNGFLAGIEWMPVDWFALQVEHDAEAFNAAARLTVPEQWLYDIGKLTFSSRFYSNTEHSEKDVYWGVDFVAPFNKADQTYKSKTAAAPAPIKTNHPAKNNPLQNASEADVTKQAKPVKSEVVASLDKPELNRLARKLRNVLIADGFESVRVGFNTQPVVIVSFENAVFNHNEVDALGLVAGRISELFSGTNAEFVLQLKNHGLPMLALSGDVSSYERFINNNERPVVKAKLGAMRSIGGVSWVGLHASNTSYFKPRVTISPELSSTHATELGVFDYSLALRADFTVPVWKGAGFNVSAQTVVSESDDFKEFRAFNERSEHNGVSSAFFYQTYELPWGIYNQTKIGFFREFHKYTGIINETAWVSPEGDHKVTNTYGFFDYKDYDADRDYHTVEYQYNWAEKDISFHVTGGKFWRKDSGFKVETRFWFGDSYVAVYGEETDAQVAGIALSIPLSKRKSMNVTRYGQIKGNHAWRHQVGTRIGNSSNYLVYQQAYAPKSNISLNRTFFNQGRNSVDYIYANLERLREAYLTYK
ncbi:YjbH domain-containing protein [Pseudoalteromonas luteoviolacea]|uniref:Porin n=1 Tax=Pseudoalteromonas luteoviolacea S4054 TaxID=1129367 RepID=A0A0F6ACT0_9GAMM|nr:YjbH domain-containing protein [Pseudoalteromonas luteoviolacea]AOT09685.1 hypothetical protein S4054249_18485 [Pseudoalteromonas luteoviolacea]AOT14598.1 hypothetical protein S40542_18455 [Pseudoalteromonas luteoviolacea]AOT19512.1 hypothetical protein S4054_18460 [Pseudoalteromonas luteoviolacea]KKE83953.1 hypothetical protein N479_11110 [Pseudoalteromonas luteoviolacea S4054]KZN77347.1 hypothetical protein N481_04650 [Pseudoalteromonas luteoviolacea S4047-1]